ncbi:hypothetical protein HRH25_03715, partial [Flavisolibacter sp. BT320]|nr:hypothetical protein [Flavisolibacter longurius]
MRTNSTINQKRSLLVKLFLRSFTALTLVFFSFAAFGQLAPVIKPTGGFAIDGGLKSNTPTAPTAAQPLPWLAPGQGDWFEGPAGAGGFVLNADRSAVEAGKSGYGTDPFSTNDNIFTNGSKFNDYIGALQWFTNSAPDKNDINNALYHVARDNSNNQWVFISGDRLSTNGTSYIDFELLQGSVTKTGITSGGFTGTPVADKPNGGGRTENDIIISMEYTNGGSKPIVRIYQWKLNNGTWSYKLVENLPANTAFAETNRYGAETGVPYSVFGSTNPSTYQQYAFVEAAVNISYLLSLAGEACSGLNISTLWVKTKASASSTAALKDFMDPIPVNFQFGSSSIVNPGPFCSNDTEPVTLSAEPSGGTFTINRNGVISSITTFTPSTEGPGSYPIRYSYSGCIANTIFVVESAATANASNPAAVCASSAAIQVVGTYGGGATGGQWSGGAGSFGTQEKDATAKTITATYTPTEAEIAAGTVQLTFTTTGQATPCAAATKNVTATINAAATANASNPAAVCASSAAIQVVGTYGGGATGGQWSGGAGSFG